MHLPPINQSQASENSYLFRKPSQANPADPARQRKFGLQAPSDFSRDVSESNNIVINDQSGNLFRPGQPRPVRKVNSENKAYNQYFSLDPPSNVSEPTSHQQAYGRR